MRLLPLVKGGLLKLKGQKNGDAQPSEVSIHATPPGECPKNGPKPSIIAVILFYVSKIMTMIGFILVFKAVFIETVGLPY
jgi:hypothetical protein